MVRQKRAAAPSHLRVRVATPRARPSRRAQSQVHGAWIVRLLEREGPASRRRLNRQTGLSMSSLTAICERLIQEGLVVESGTASPEGRGRGRRQRLLQLNAGGLGAVGLVYQRGFIAAAVVDLQGAVRWSRRWNGPFKGTREAFLERLRAALKEALRASPIPRHRLLAVGVGDPGLVDRRTGRTIRAVNMPDWKDVPVAEALQEVARLPVCLERGDGLQALGEAVYGAGEDAQNVLYVTLVEEGVGGGITENGRLVYGRDGTAGEIGHLSLTDGGPLCGCGLYGCLEAHIAPNRLIAQALQAAKEGLLRHPLVASAKTLSFADLLRAGLDGDQAVAGIFQEAARKLARAVGSVLNLLNPHAIVLGGLLVDAEPLMGEAFRRELHRHAIAEMLQGVEIRLARLGDAAVFAGVAALVRERMLAGSFAPFQEHTLSER